MRLVNFHLETLAPWVVWSDGSPISSKDLKTFRYMKRHSVAIKAGESQRQWFERIRGVIERKKLPIEKVS